MSRTRAPNVSSNGVVTVGSNPLNTQTNFPSPGFPWLINEIRKVDGEVHFTADTYSNLSPRPAKLFESQRYPDSGR